jgi:hypothetical protein
VVFIILTLLFSTIMSRALVVFLVDYSTQGATRLD